MREAMFLSHSEMEHQVAFPSLVFLNIHLFCFTYLNIFPYMYVYLMNVYVHAGLKSVAGHLELELQ